MKIFASDFDFGKFWILMEKFFLHFASFDVDLDLTVDSLINEFVRERFWA